MGRPPSAQEATALLARARYAHHAGQYVWLTYREHRDLAPKDRLPVDGTETLYGVSVAIDDERAERQIAAAIARPAPPMDWETTGG